MTLTAVDCPGAKNEINILLLSAFLKGTRKASMISESKSLLSCFSERFLHHLRS